MTCRKSFNTEKAYQNHIGSKKHREVAAKFELKKNADDIMENRLNRGPSESVEAEEEMLDDDDDEDLEMEEV